MSESNSTVKIWRFDGTKEEYTVWYNQFKAACNVKGVLDALKPSFVNEFPNEESMTLNESDPAEKKKIKAKKKNDLSLSMSLLVMNKAKLFSKV